MYTILGVYKKEYITNIMSTVVIPIRVSVEDGELYKELANEASMPVSTFLKSTLKKAIKTTKKN